MDENADETPRTSTSPEQTATDHDPPQQNPTDDERTAAADGGQEWTRAELDRGESDGLRPSVRRRTVGFLLTVAVVGAVFLYDLLVVPGDEKLISPWRRENVPGWDAGTIEWLFVLALAIVVWYGLLPLARRPRLARRYWGRIRSDKRALFSLLAVVGFYLIGTAGPAVLDALRVTTGFTGPATARGMAPMQPPLGFTTPMSNTGGTCVGAVTDGMCHGTWRHPLGTNKRLQDVLVVTVEGTQTAMYVATVVPLVAAPIGVLVGTVAAYSGGRLDELVMRYVDLQLVVPPFFAYLFLQVFFGRSYVLFVLVFGLLNWGSLARVVRSEALSKTDTGYVRAARDAGSSSWRTIRHHVFPNVSNTVVTGVTSMMPTVVLVEVSLGYLQLSDPVDTSWGNIISGAAGLVGGGAGEVVIDGFAFTSWWTELVPVGAMLVTLVSLSLLGDSLRDVLDPRESE